MEQVFIYDDNKYPIFRIDIEDRKEYKDTSFAASVYEITSWEATGSKEPFEGDEELYLTCYIKWDSCSHFYFGEKDESGNQDGYLHICGVDSFKRHSDLMKSLYDLAFKTMDRSPDPSEVWK